MGRARGRGKLLAGSPGLDIARARGLVKHYGGAAIASPAPKNKQADDKATYAFSLFPERVSVEDIAEFNISLGPELKFGEAGELKAGEAGAKTNTARYSLPYKAMARASLTRTGFSNDTPRARSTAASSFTRGLRQGRARTASRQTSI
jgi:hypothetical protein